MTILLLGDGHTHGHGLSARQLSYMSHFIRQLSRSRTGRAITVEVYAHLTLPESTALLARLPLHKYDLIVVQAGSDLMQRGVSGRGAACLTTRSVWPILNQPVSADKRSARPALLKRIGHLGKALLSVALSAVPLAGCPGRLAELLKILRPYRHHVLLMTPFPGRALPGRWLRERSRSVLIENGTDQGFSVFDSGSVVQPREEYFLTGDDEHLNAISHELIGHALFDFYQSAPTIVTIQITNRN